MLNFLPKMILGGLHLIALRVALDLLQDEVNLLHLEVDDVIHDALGKLHMLLELVEIEFRLSGKRMIDVAVEVEAKQTAAVVRAEGNLTAGIGAHRAEA